MRHDDKDALLTAVHPVVADAVPDRSHPRPWPPQVPTGRCVFRGPFAFLDGGLTDGEVPPLYRLREAGSASTWGFALHLASSDRHGNRLLPIDSSTSTTPEQALDCASNLVPGHQRPSESDPQHDRFDLDIPTY